jgi:hypothetical protein
LTQFINTILLSFVNNSISRDLYDATNAKESFEVKINANAIWSATPQNTWLTVDNTSGNKGYIRVTVAENTGVLEQEQ